MISRLTLVLVWLGCAACSTINLEQDNPGNTPADTIGAKDTTADPGTGQDDVAVGEVPNCTDYCQLVLASCGTDEEYSPYPNASVCKAMCQTWAGFPAGKEGDQSGNSIGCRAYHAAVAADEPETHCEHAGPAGGNVCGEWCDNYCHLAMRNCTGNNAQYDSLNDCLAVCDVIPDEGIIGEKTGDSLQCRMSHLVAAGTEPPASAVASCADGGELSPACTQPQCSEWCSALEAGCTGKNAQFPSQGDCLTFCEEAAHFEPGLVSDTGGNTLGCRIYHATVASTEPQAHCPHAGPTGGNQCGGWCTNYCTLLLATCSGGNFPNVAASDCTEACDGFAHDGVVGDQSGDTVQCRLTFLVNAALAKPQSAKEHCPNAVPKSPVCQ